jgi:hypothetical protein
MRTEGKAPTSLSRVETQPSGSTSDARYGRTEIPSQMRRRNAVHIVNYTPSHREARRRHPPRRRLDAVIDRDTGQIETGGDKRLAGALLKGLHKRLF